MKTIVDKNTGEHLYATVLPITEENELAIDELLTEFYIRPFFNFDTRQFYEGASQLQIDEYNNNQIES